MREMMSFHATNGKVIHVGKGKQPIREEHMTIPTNAVTLEAV